MPLKSIARAVSCFHEFLSRDSESDVRDRPRTRLAIAALQAISIILTWKLWSAREMPPLPPNLPLLSIPSISVGWLLLGSLFIIPFRPLLGVALHTGVLVAAIAMDQMRIQPEFISLAILLWGTFPFAGTILLSRAHLFSLWFFAGFHKLLSPDYFERTAGRISGEMLPFLDESAAYVVALIAPLLEITIALLMISRRTRHGAAWLALFVHVGILLYLVRMSFAIRPIGGGEFRLWNVAVWPWNIALAGIGFSMIAGWKTRLIASIRESRLSWRIAALLLTVMPFGYYFGVVDAYLAHCLYSENVPAAWYKNGTPDMPANVADRKNSRNRERLSYGMMSDLEVPFPPAHRLYEQYFRRVAKRGDALYIEDPRRWVETQNRHDRFLTVDGEYRNGLEEGHWIHFFPNGKKEGEGDYRRGEMHGRWEIWFEDGRHVEAIYDEGKLVRKQDL